MEKQLTETQSLELITAMIRDSRSRMARNSGIPFLIWGYVTVVVAIIEAVATKYQLGPTWQLGWMAIPLFGISGMRIFRRKTAGATSRHKRILTPLWITLGTTAFIISITTAHYPTVTLLLSLGCVISGIVMAEKSLTACGISGIAASAIIPLHKFFHVTSSTTHDEYTNILAAYVLIFAAIIAVIMIIPGHILNRKNNRACSES